MPEARHPGTERLAAPYRAFAGIGYAVFGWSGFPLFLEEPEHDP
jgi:hypothetical protein